MTGYDIKSFAVNIDLEMASTVQDTLCAIQTSIISIGNPLHDIDGIL